jgi:polyketide biosynthesis enoyl-CoA hydratase PksI
MSKLVTVGAVEEGVFVLHMDDEANRNRLSEELSGEIIGALRSLAQEPALRVLVITGRSDVFCAGATLDQLEKMTAGEMPTRALSIPEHMLSFPLPIIGALEGHAVGGGLSMALCCDMTIAAEGSRYGANFTEMGFTPGMGIISLLPMQVGHCFACEMLLGAKLYKGRELSRRNLFSEVVPAREVKRVALDLAHTIAGKPRDVLSMVKEALAVPRRRALADSTMVERLMHLSSFGNPQSRALIRSMYLS